MDIIEPAHPVNQAASSDDVYFQTRHLKADIGARTLRGGAVTMATQLLKFVISMAGTVVLARILTPKDYGLIGMVAVIIGFVGIFKDLGLSQATIQRAEINAGQITALFWVNAALCVGMMLLCVAISPLVARFYDEPRLRLITAVYGVGFVLGGLTVQHEALLRRQMRFVLLSVAELVALCVGTGTAIVLAMRGAGYWALVASQLALGLVYVVLIWQFCSWRPGLPRRNSGVQSMLAFGGNLTGFAVINYFARNIDNMLIGKFWGSQQLGVYAKAYQLLLLPMEQINGPVSAVALPALSRLADSPERYRQVYVRIIQKVALLTVPGVAFMIATSDWLVRVVLGPNWAEASSIFAILGVAGLIQPIASTTGLLFVSQDRSRDMFRWGMIGSTILIVGIIAGLPWGAVGVATSYSVAFSFVTVPALFWFVGRSGPVRTSDFYRALAPFALVTPADLAVCWAFRRWGPITTPLLGLTICLALVVVTTLVSLVVTGEGRAILADVQHAIRSLTKRASAAAAKSQ